jgi:hypothetical protein
MLSGAVSTSAEATTPSPAKKQRTERAPSFIPAKAAPAAGGSVNLAARGARATPGIEWGREGLVRRFSATCTVAASGCESVEDRRELLLIPPGTMVEGTLVGVGKQSLDR